MHIPDGFLDTKTAIATAVLSAAAVATALQHLKRNVTRKQIPMMGLAAAFIFAAQMLNFPVAGGTSGHLMGAVLCSVLLGPSASIIVMSTVLIVQCFLFADGGITTLGANIFNMAVAGTLTGYTVYRIVQRIIGSVRGKFAAIAFASWCSTVAASILCAGELAWSGTANWSATFVAMTNIHMLIGLGEGIITTLVIAGIWKTRPELLDRQFVGTKRFYEFISYGTIFTIGLILFAAPFISTLPDGLERVASSAGFDVRALKEPILNTPLAGYRMNGIITPELATIIAGMTGMVVVFILSYTLAKVVAPKSK